MFLICWYTYIYFCSSRLNQENTVLSNKLKASDKNTLPPRKKRKIDVNNYFVNESYSDFEKDADSSESSEMEEEGRAEKASEILEDVEDNEEKKLDEQTRKNECVIDSNCCDLSNETKCYTSSYDSNSKKEILTCSKQTKSDCHENKIQHNINSDNSNEETSVSIKQGASKCLDSKNTNNAEHVPAVFVPLNRKPEIQVNI